MFLFLSVVEFLDLLHIAEHILFLVRIAQEGGGVIYRGDYVFASFKKYTVLLCYHKVGLYQAFCGDASETYDDLRVDKAHLCAQKIKASVLLLGFGIAVLWGAAF